MDRELMRELLEHKAQGYQAEGRERALVLAGRDILAAAKGRLAAAELFCLRLALRGAVDALSSKDGHNAHGAQERLARLLPTVVLRG